MNITKQTSLSLILTLNACTNEETQVKELTFEDIEKEFGFEKPLSEISKEAILAKYSIEDYKNLLADAIERKPYFKKKSTLKSTCAEYRVIFIEKDTRETTCIPVPDDVFILDQAEECGIDLPYSCRAGACSTCVGRCSSGTIDDSNQCFLDDYQRAMGYCLLCVTYPCSDLRIVTFVEDEL